MDKGGEDACYISKKGQSFGVADGVGGWSQYGIDPGLYSSKLMELCKKYAEDHAKYGINPIDVLNYAYTNTKSIQGSSTAIVATVQGPYDTNADELPISIANLGDSGFIIIDEKGNVRKESIPQTKGFNFPFQLGGESPDEPNDSDLYDIKLKKNEVLILATDGLFDNLFTHDIGQTVYKYMNNNNKQIDQQYMNELAYHIAKYAFDTSKNETIITPFAREAMQYGYRDLQGGKEDDITLIVCAVKDDNSISAQQINSRL